MPGPRFLDGESVELHTIEREDAEFMQQLINDPRIRQTLQSVDPVTHQQETEWVDSLAEADGWHFLICDDETPLGTIGLSDYNDAWGVAEAGFMIAPEHWNNGYATDALESLCEYAFEERRLNKVVAKAYATNPASLRVLRKVGFTEEGQLRAEAFVEGEYVDIYRCGLLADEWRETE
ncbi:GNAT family N-acetyltransferase [Salinibaculum salinum]|uniref:GNAT family N-acetyltransferase n=1 Tax=Salinibaculum salinum TaxID=3131996 RepID=UPI0030EB93F9